MVYDLAERLQAQITVSYGFMPVFVTFKRIFGIVDMNGF